MGRTVSRSLFLSSHPQEAIPFRFIGLTLGMVLASSLYAQVASRLRRDRLVMADTSRMVPSLLLFRALLATPAGDSL